VCSGERQTAELLGERIDLDTAFHSRTMSADQIDHIEANVQRMAEIHAKHAANATWLQRQVVNITLRLGRPSTIGVALLAVLLWCGYNVLGGRLGLKPFDPPPFAILELVASVAALFTTLLIVTTQRREEQLARHRAQLTLNLVALSEQKVAKVIELLEEQRRENPLLPTRADRLAADMAHAADPDHVLERIIETHEGEAEA
jgi:uncharacterized membrane protein